MRRAVLILLAILVAVPLLAVAAFYVFVDEAALKARVAEATRRATGRELTIAGPVGIGWSFTPTLRLQDVRLANPPGFSRADTVQVGAVEARVALWPLLSGRVDVQGITIERPDVLLERDAAGRGNWEITPPAPTTTEPAAVPAPRARMNVVVQGVRVRDGQFAWRGGGHPVVVRIPDLQAAGEAEQTRISGELVVAGERFALAGITGPLRALAASPADLRLDGAGAVLTARGGPGAGWNVEAVIPDFSSLSGFAGRSLPPLRDVRAVARLAGGLQSVTLEAGPLDLSSVAPGLTLARLTLAASAPERPVELAAAGTSRGQPVALAANAGSLTALLGGRSVPIQATLAAAGASVSAQGSFGVLAGEQWDTAVVAQVPDLQAFGAVFGAALPAWAPVSLDARLMPAPGGVAIRGMRLAAPQGDLAGDIVLGWLPRPFLRGSLVSQRLDLDALRVATPAPAVVATPVTPPATDPPPPQARVLPDTPLPFAALTRADADVQVTVSEAVLRAASYRNVEARILLQDGRLRLDPLRMVTPGGPVVGQVVVDAAAPTVAVVIQAPGLAAGPLLGAPEGTVGTVELEMSLVGRGASVRTLAATLEGHVGLAMVDGELDNSWLLDVLGNALRGVNIPFDGNGRSRVRCLAVRVESAAGQAALRTLLLDTTRLRLEGEGGMNLAEETLDLRLRPLVRLGGTGVGVSVKVGGTFRAPKPVMDAGAGQPGRVGMVIGALTQPGPQAGEDGCAAALSLARGGRDGPVPAPAAAVVRPADLLRGLFR